MKTMKVIIATLLLTAVTVTPGPMVRMESATTNIVIDPSYAGTIQVGTNFYQLSDLRPTYPVQWATNTVFMATNFAVRCDFLSHRWEPGCGMAGCLVNHGDRPMRHCIDCKLTQTAEWK